SDAGAVERDAARKGLTAVALIFEDEHGDHWLSELLGGTSAPAFPSAAAALATAIRATERGDFDGAFAHAHRSASLFDDAKSEAGALRARLEMVYDLHLSEKARDCVRLSAELRPRLRSARYPALAVQLATELGICLNMAGEVGAAEAVAREAVDAARSAALP